MVAFLVVSTVYVFSSGMTVSPEAGATPTGGRTSEKFAHKSVHTGVCQKTLKVSLTFLNLVVSDAGDGPDEDHEQSRHG